MSRDGAAATASPGSPASPGAASPGGTASPGNAASHGEELPEQFRATPNAEKYILEADALRRRQLGSALIHGSDRTWRERRRIWPAATGGVVAVVIIVMVVAAVGAFHRQQQITAEKERQQQAEREAAEIAGFPVQAYRGHGVTINVPSEWKRRETGGGARFTDPKKDRWITLSVADDPRGAREILQDADKRFSAGCCGLRYYQWLGLRSAKLGKHKGAELEYTGVDATGERRRLILRVVSVAGRAYRVNLSVPDQQLNASQPILNEAARSFTIR